MYYIKSIASSLAALACIVLPNEAVDFNAPKKRKTGVKYPFSNKRQNDRYARQIKAAQLNMLGVK